MPLCGIDSKLKTRIANESEREIYREAVKEAGASDEIVLAYLVELDGIETTDETPIDPASRRSVGATLGRSQRLLI